MDYKMSHKLFWISAIAGALLVLVHLLTKQDWIGIIGIGALAFAIIEVSLFYRCPYCGGGLHISWNMADLCTRCRRRLNG